MSCDKDNVQREVHSKGYGIYLKVTGKHNNENLTVIVDSLMEFEFEATKAEKIFIEKYIDCDFDVRDICKKSFGRFEDIIVDKAVNIASRTVEWDNKTVSPDCCDKYKFMFINTNGTGFVVSNEELIRTLTAFRDFLIDSVEDLTVADESDFSVKHYTLERNILAASIVFHTIVLEDNASDCNSHDYIKYVEMVNDFKSSLVREAESYVLSTDRVYQDLRRCVKINIANIVWRIENYICYMIGKDYTDEDAKKLVDTVMQTGKFDYLYSSI